MKDNSGSKDSIYYPCRTLFNNKTTNILNSIFLYTLKTNKGSITYLLTPNVNYFSVKDKYITKPVFTSGYYLGKNIEIIVEVLPDADQTRQITVVFL